MSTVRIVESDSRLAKYTSVASAKSTGRSQYFDIRLCKAGNSLLLPGYLSFGVLVAHCGNHGNHGIGKLRCAGLASHIACQGFSFQIDFADRIVQSL